MKPATNAGSMAWVMRRVGGDQKGSDSLSACRRTSRKEPAIASAPTQAQKRMKARGDLILKIQPARAATVPMAPLKVMMGANARR